MHEGIPELGGVSESESSSELRSQPSTGLQDDLRSSFSNVLQFAESLGKPRHGDQGRGDAERNLGCCVPKPQLRTTSCPHICLRLVYVCIYQMHI